jgi:hypothetical protein
MQLILSGGYTCIYMYIMIVYMVLPLGYIQLTMILPEFFRYSSDFGFGFRSEETRRKVSHGFGPGEFSSASDPKPKFSEIFVRY